MLSDLIAKTRKIGLAVHPDNTKVLTNQDAGDLDHMKIESLEIEVLPPGKSTIYLGRKLAIHKSQDVELEYRLECGWESSSPTNKNFVENTTASEVA